MAKKAYEESRIAAVALKIREKTGGEEKYTTAEMPSGVDAVFEKGIDAGVAASQQIITQKDAEISNLEKEVEALETSVSEKETAIAELTDTVAEKDTAIAEHEATIESQIGIITAKDNVIAGQNQTISEKNAEINGLTESIAEKDATIESLDDTIDGLNATVNAKDATIAEKETEISELEAELPVRYETGYDAGKQAERDAFWDAYQDYGKRINYAGAFYGYGWDDRTFKPKYDIKPQLAGTSGMFRDNKITDLKALLTQCNVSLDLSKVTTIAYAFYGSSITAIPVIDISKATNVTQAFYNCRALMDIDFVVSENTKFADDTFRNCEALKNLGITGILASSLNLQWSRLLSRASIESIMNALSAITSGLTVTLSATAVDNAFGDTVYSDRAAGTETINGLAITTAEDGSITINGTATADTRLDFNFPVAAKDGEVWTVSFGGSVSDIADLYALPIQDVDGGVYPNTQYEEIHCPMSEGWTAWATMTISNGRTVDNFTLKPSVTFTGAEWSSLTATKPNWTISLA